MAERAYEIDLRIFGLSDREHWTPDKGEEIIDYSLINSRMEKFREESNLDWQSILERRNDFEKR